MKTETLKIENIPAIVWGKESEHLYLYVHGKLSSKDEAVRFAEKASQRGYQVLSFDLPEHGDRMAEDFPCTAENGVHDLDIVGKYARQRWHDISLYACSLGAYFSLLAYQDLPLRKCLFLSPILDMERLLANMMASVSADERMLEEKKRIPTPMGETLDWDDYSYVTKNKIHKWNAHTSILYGAEDVLMERALVESFAERYGCALTVLEGCEHWFHTGHALSFLDTWLDEHI